MALMNDLQNELGACIISTSTVLARQVRIMAAGKMRNYISYATSLFLVRYQLDGHPRNSKLKLTTGLQTECKHLVDCR